MSTVKTAISIDSTLFHEVEELANQTHLSRSQLFAQAIENLIRRKDNLILFQRLNELYGKGLESDDAEQLQRTKKAHARLVKGTWK